MSGQALVESIIIVLTLLVVLYGIVIVAKRVDIAQGTILGSRYAAWERSVWSPGGKSDAQIGSEIRDRIFSGADSPIAAQGASGAASLNPLWTRRDGSDALASYRDDEAHLGVGKTPGLLFNKVTEEFFKAFNTINDIVYKISGVHAPQFQPNVDGLYTARSQPVIRAYEAHAVGAATFLDMARFPELGETRMQRRPVMLVTDTWSPRSDGTAGECKDQSLGTTVCQVAALTPTNLLSGWVNKVINCLGYVAPEWKDFRFGYIDPTSTPDYSKSSP